MIKSIQQRDELHKKIWAYADDVRGAIEAWDFKHYVLGTLFYRFLSENFTAYMEEGSTELKYASLADDDPRLELIKDDTLKSKGFFIYPSQLFENVVKNCDNNDNLNIDLRKIFDSIENSAVGYPSEKVLKGLFADFDVNSSNNRLGDTVDKKNNKLRDVLKGLAEFDFGDFVDNEIDLLGDAYEFLISNYAANAGKSGGEYFTPQCVSKLLCKLAFFGQDKVNKVYDPACGSAGLLLQAIKLFGEDKIEDGFFGQDTNPTLYNLARMNMFLHNVNYNKFDIKCDDTLLNPQFMNERPFDVIVSNPPFSIKWEGKDDPTLINDERFAPVGVLAPKSNADLAFVLTALNHLSSKGRAAIVSFPGILYRSGAEEKIRKYLIDNNYVETVISLAGNIFFGTSIAVNILVLSKHKENNLTQFIDASNLYKKATNNNVLTDEHIEQIMDLFAKKQNIEFLARNVEYEEIKNNNYNLAVSSYVEQKDNREIIDIAQLNEEIKNTVSNIDTLRIDISHIVSQIEMIERGL